MKITAKKLILKAGVVLCMLVVLLVEGCCVFGGGDSAEGRHRDGGEGHHDGGKPSQR